MSVVLLPDVAVQVPHEFRQMRAEHLVEPRYHVPVRVRGELPADSVRAALDPRAAVGAVGRLPIVVPAPPLGVAELGTLLARLLVEIVDLGRFYEPLDLRRVLEEVKKT